MKYILFLIIPFILYGSSSFITPTEYAAQLYKNPRGIGCNLCHGERGEGKLIANYVHKKKKKSFRGPEIDEIKFTAFHKALSVRKKGMPRYFLTDKEIRALYLHLHKDDKMEKKSAK